ncbi:NAD(P)-dependent oxidoreductase [Plantactinospora sp. S1510]|uniref:dTDP-4-dehydrorhamnose reductase n=1 Tax=Plantactinospora alkalitolerans TaxID=2789879 RepID=A0ABS0H338_9ACTN|nr:NAD(P)-dependent oxidoreductase [Plantactinospora alkalitolerans]MBF9132734.1 NAD(P)-dependent oxidoreductase [Plantactinospora alkalitolerans]
MTSQPGRAAASGRHGSQRRVMVTGAAGMLGSAVLAVLEKTGAQLVRTDIKPGWLKLDVRNRDDVNHVTGVFSPDLVIHLAAATGLEVCEADPQLSWSTNAAGAENVALACAAVGATLVYVSTARVFDGTADRPYTESDAPNPVNEFGRSKLCGEELVTAICKRSFVVRAGWTMGEGQHDHTFVGAVLEQLRDGADTIFAVGEQFGSPTYTADFARCLLRLVDTERYGLYHMVSGGGPSRAEMAAQILAELDLADRVRLVTVDTDHFADRYPVARPRSEVLAPAALDDLGLNDMRPWDDALSHYLQTEWSDPDQFLTPKATR